MKKYLERRDIAKIFLYIEYIILTKLKTKCYSKNQIFYYSFNNVIPIIFGLEALKWQYYRLISNVMTTTIAQKISQKNKKMSLYDKY
jgi:hypothetical protein